jgi:hypothetical protein
MLIIEQASAEFLADIFLCPFEAVKVRMQTTLPPFANTMREGMSKIIAKEGVSGYVDFQYFHLSLLFAKLENPAVSTKVSTHSGVVKSHTPW